MSRISKVLVDTTSRMLFRTAQVTAVTEHGDHLRSIELTGDALKNATWNVGDKLQVRTDPEGFTTRTYTPVSWDSARGSTSLLAYAHGPGPGSAWVREVAAGHVCHVFGPRASLKLDNLAGPVLFVGDETSFALARAWRARNPDAGPFAELFEVGDPDESGVALDFIGLSSASVFPRQDGVAHLEQLSATVIELLRTHRGASLCLTGKAQTIAIIRRDIKAAGLAGRPVRVKAYWDEHRSGLD